MSGRYPPLDRTQVEAVLKKLGCSEKRHFRSSHAQWEGYVKGQRRIITVDHYKSRKEKYGHMLLAKMIQQTGLTKKEFYSYL